MRDITFFEVYRDKNDKENVKKRIFIFIILLVIIVASSFIVNNFIQIQRLKGDVSQLDHTINDPAIKDKVVVIQKKRTDVKNMEKELKTLERFNLFIEKNDVVNEKLLNGIFSRVIDNMFLTNIEVNDHKVMVTGVTKSKEDVSEFEHSLEGIEDFEYIFVQLIEVDEDNTEFYRFVIEIKVKSVEIEEIDSKAKPKAEPKDVSTENGE